MMWARLSVCVGLALALGPCEPVEPPPVMPENPIPAPDESPARPVPLDTGSEVPLLPAESLLEESALRALLPRLLPGCTHYGQSTIGERDVFAGFAAREGRPLAVASIRRLHSQKRTGSVLVAVGVDAADRITAVATAAPKGTLRGLRRYEKQRRRFLAQFRGRALADGLDGVAAVPGAESLCESLIRYVEREGRFLSALRRDAAFVASVSPPAWRLSPPRLPAQAPSSQPGAKTSSPRSPPRPRANGPVAREPARVGPRLDTRFTAVMALCATALLGILLLATRRRRAA